MLMSDTFFGEDANLFASHFVTFLLLSLLFLGIALAVAANSGPCFWLWIFSWVRVHADNDIVQSWSC